MTKYTWRRAKDGEGYVIMRGKNNIVPTNIVRTMNTKWGRYVKQINPKTNSIIIITKPKAQPEDEFSESLKTFADEILARIGMSTVVVGVESLSDIVQLSEEQMEHYGWVRSSRVLAYIEDKFADLVKDEEE